MTATLTRTRDLTIARCRALADATRLAIIDRLRDGERCVCDLTEALDASQPLLSFHIKILRNAGLIDGRRSGRWVYYSLNSAALEQLREFIEELGRPRAVGVRVRRKCD